MTDRRTICAMRRPTSFPAATSRAAVTLAALLLPLSALAACGAEQQVAADPVPCTFTPGGEAAKPADLPPDQAAVSTDVDVTIATSQGDLHATLDGAGAPCTVTSFLSLADQGYFDDTPCHRLTTQGIFVLQCGDPGGNGFGGPGYTVPDEYDGSETYPAGTLAMANTGTADSGGSQFFLVYEDTELPPQYTVFGTLDGDAVSVIRSLAAAGSTPEGDGAPNTSVQITDVTED